MKLRVSYTKHTNGMVRWVITNVKTGVEIKKGLSWNLDKAKNAARRELERIRQHLLRNNHRGLVHPRPDESSGGRGESESQGQVES